MEKFEEICVLQMKHCIVKAAKMLILSYILIMTNHKIVSYMVLCMSTF